MHTGQPRQSRGRRRPLSAALVGLALAVALVSLSACGSSSGDGSDGDGGSGSAGASTTSGAKKSDVVLLNNFMGNSWRVIMMRSAQLLAEQPPLNASVDSMKLMLTENTAAAQNAALNSLSLNRPDVLLIDAADPTAVNQEVTKLCDDGTVVVSFDVLLTAPCAWKVAIDEHDFGVVAAKWMAREIGGRGKIFLDEGQAGTLASQQWVSGVEEVLRDHPDITVKRYYSEFTPGGEQSSVTNLVNTNRDVRGILGFAFGGPALKVLRRTGLPLVPVTGFSYNESLLTCKQMRADCLLRSNPAWVSGEALKLGLEVADGRRKGEPEEVMLQGVPWYYSGDTKPETEDPVFPIDTSAEPDVSGGLILPLSPPWARLDTDEVLQKPEIG